VTDADSTHDERQSEHAASGQVLDTAGESASTVREIGWRRWAPILVPTAVYLLAVIYHLRPVVLSCPRVVLGPMGDNTAGGVWSAWVYEQEGGLPFHPTTDLTNAPTGEPFWRTDSWTQLVPSSLTWFFTHFTNAVCSYNGAILVGFVASAVSMYLLAYWLTRHVLISTLAGYAYAFSPFALVKAAGHLDYVHQWPFPLIVLTGLRCIRAPSRRNGIIFGVTAGVAGFVDGYYLLFGALLFGCLMIALITQALVASRGEPLRQVLATSRPVGWAVFGYVTVLSPVALLALTSRGSLGASVARSPDDMDVYSSDAVDYLLPARTNVLLDRWFGHYQDAHLGGSNFSEKTLAIGWVPLAFAVLAVAWVLFRRPSTAPPGWRIRDLRLSVTALAATALVLAIASGPRVWHVAGVKLPGLSYFVSVVAPYWRVYARLFVAVNACILATAAVGAWMLAQRIGSKPLRAATAGALVVAFVVTSAWSERFPYGWFDYEAAPSGYKWIASQMDVDVIADYPVWSPELQPDSSFSTYQPVHGKALVNAKVGALDGRHPNDHLIGLADRQTLGLLRHMGVDLVVVHPSMMPGEPPAAPVAGLIHQASFSFAQDAATSLTPDQARRHAYLAPWYDMDVYRIAPGEAATAAAFTQSGFFGDEVTGWRISNWMTREAVIDVQSFVDDPGQIRVSMTLQSFGTDRVVTMRQGGHVIWEGTIPTTGTAVEFVSNAGSVEIQASGEPTPVQSVNPASTDPRALSVYVSDLYAAAVER
jgi:hypothetical protein